MKKSEGTSNERVFKLLISIDGRISNIEERLSDMATKGQLDKVKHELLGEMRVIGKAVDKDALAIVNLEKRVVRIEKQLAISNG
ncbi:MAG: hypothetical protein AAB899_03275 [Patescibacteria group bacterium]